jgi:hypothetical protein
MAGASGKLPIKSSTTTTSPKAGHLALKGHRVDTNFGTASEIHPIALDESAELPEDYSIAEEFNINELPIHKDLARRGNNSLKRLASPAVSPSGRQTPSTDVSDRIRSVSVMSPGNFFKSSRGKAYARQLAPRVALWPGKRLLQLRPCHPPQDASTTCITLKNHP